MDNTHLTPVYDFGLSEDELSALLAIPPLTERDIAAGIVDEADLARLGRWAGAPPPKRWIPLI